MPVQTTEVGDRIERHVPLPPLVVLAHSQQADRKDVPYEWVHLFQHIERLVSATTLGLPEKVASLSSTYPLVSLTLY